MATSSQQAGFLAPVAEDVYDDALDDQLQATIVGISGLPGALVRPRWQPNPPNQPAFNTNWCAFGLTRKVVDTFAYDRHNPAGSAGEGQSIIERDETLYVLHSFYGPNSSGICERFRDGFEISQNRDALRDAGLFLVELEEAVTLPALLQEKWVRRVDVTVVYRRRTKRTYQVKTLVTGQMGLDNERYITPINASNP